MTSMVTIANELESKTTDQLLDMYLDRDVAAEKLDPYGETAKYTFSACNILKDRLTEDEYDDLMFDEKRPDSQK